MKMWMPDCKDISRLVSESMDRRLSWRQRLGVRLHLLMCRYCSRYRQQLELLRRVLKSQAELSADASQPVLEERVKDRLRRLVDQHGSSRR